MAQRPYENFDLRITGGGGRYYAEVLQSPAGEFPQVEFHCSFDQPWSELLTQLENAVLRGSGHFRGPSGPQERFLRDFGREMFQAVFVQPGQIQLAYEQSLLKVEERKDEVLGLRLKLRIEPPELASLPWEFLWDDERRHYISLRAKTPIVRYLQLQQPVGHLKVDGPLRILGMIANPASPEGMKLDTDLERTVIDDAITDLEREGKIEFRWVRGGKPTDLLDMMNKGPWHVFHFIGHGGISEPDENSGRQEGYLVFEDDHGGARSVAAEDLNWMLQEEPRLVLLNCCESAKCGKQDIYASPAATLVRSGIPAVVAMQFPISDRAAVQLASGFYRALAQNLPVDAAVTEARRRVAVNSKVEAGIPVLFMRSKDGQLFEWSPPADRAPGREPQDPPRRPEPPAPPAPQVGRQVPVQSPGELLERADRHAKAKRFAEALADADGALELDPEDPHSHWTKGLIHLRAKSDAARSGDIEAAIACFSKAIQLAPDRGSYYKARALAHIKSGAHQLALEDLGRAVELDPEKSGPLRLRAQSKHELGDEAGAQDDLTRAKELGDATAGRLLAQWRLQAMYRDR